MFDSWQTKQGRGFILNGRLQLFWNPGSCGLTPAPPTSLDAWQATQSRSTWQLTHAIMLRFASLEWCIGPTLVPDHTDASG